MASQTKINEALELLRDYNGENPYIRMIKRDYYEKQSITTLDNFQVEYILKNFDFKIREINKIIKIADWYGEKRQEVWNTDFIPQKLLIVSLLGITDTCYHCYVQYRASVPPVMCFIPKKAVINNFLYDDYRLIDVDFKRYDRLSMEKDYMRRMQEHQKDAVKFLLSRKKCILADDPGLGKTCSLSVAAIEGNFDSILIICPASLKTNWKRELMWYVPEKDITIIESFNIKTKPELEKMLGYGEGKSNKTREELMDEAKERGKWESNRFVIVNYDILDEFYTFSKARTEEAKQKALENNPLLKYIKNKKSLIIIDEAHKLSNNTSTRYKVIRDLIKKGEPDSVYLATGTPITNNALNFYYVLNLIENELTGDYKYYTERYCNAKTILRKGEKERLTNIYLKNRGKQFYYELSQTERRDLWDYIDKFGKHVSVANGGTNLEELCERAAHIYLRRTKDDLVLPMKTINEYYYDLTNEQQQEYNRLWTEYEKAQSEENPDKELNKQLLEGGLYRRYLSNVMVPYTEQLCDKIIQNGSKVVIACCFDEELYTLQEYYGSHCVIYNGKMNAKQKDKAVKDFMENPKILVFIGNIEAAGVGLTLTKSANLIFNSFSYVPGDNQQMQDRVHRITQTMPVNIYYQIFRNTQYENMWNMVIKKQVTIDTVIKKEDDKH